MINSLSADSLGSLAVEAQKGLTDASIIDKTLNPTPQTTYLQGGALKTGSPGVDMIGDTARTLANAALGKGLNVDSVV